MSFSKDNVKSLYLNMKANGQLSSLESSKELVLFLLKEHKMLLEVLDFAEVLSNGKD